MGDVETGPGTLTAARQYLQGQWTLQSFEVSPPGQPPIKLNGTGILTYDEYSNLDIEVRVDEKTAELLDKAGITVEQGVMSSKGRTAIDIQARTLTYIIEGQPPTGVPSGPLGLNRPRHWQVEGNILTLTTKGDDGKPVSVARWQKTP
jgi:hypothetical protein